MRISRAQSVSEYSICVIGIILVAIVMQSYIRRGLQGRHYDLVRQTTAKVSASGKSQYEPYYHNKDFTTATNQVIQENALTRGRRSHILLEDRTKRKGTSVEEINSYADE